MADDSRYHVYFVADIDAYAVNDAGRWDDNFEFHAIQSWQYPPAEHAFCDDEAREVWWREWRNRNTSWPYQGYDYVPWIWGGFGPMPPYEAKDYNLVYTEGDPSTPETFPHIPIQFFLNFPKDWDNNQDLAAPNNLVNWYVATVQSSVSPSYCKPSNHCGVGLWFTPVNQ